MNRQSHHPDPSEQAGPDRPEAEADASEGPRPAYQAPGPSWLGPADLEALAQLFPPLDAAQVRQIALAFDQGSPAVEVLLLRLVGAGLAPSAAQQLIVELRLLRERRSRASMPGAAAAAGEAAAALTAAARSYVRHPEDDEQATRAIVAEVGWSEVRARWFLSVNQDRVRQAAARLRAERPPDT